MMMTKNTKGETRWDKTKEKVAKIGEPETWKAFKVSFTQYTNFYGQLIPHA